MKTFTGLFEQITPFPALHAAWRRVRRGKRLHGDILAFEADLEPNLFALQEGLVTSAEVDAVVQSWAGHARHANSWNLRGAVYADFALRRKESRCPS